MVALVLGGVMLARCVGTVLARLVKERMLELRYTVRAKGEVEKTGSPPVGGESASL